jgi:hypothetical protein
MAAVGAHRLEAREGEGERRAPEHDVCLVTVGEQRVCRVYEAFALVGAHWLVGRTLGGRRDGVLAQASEGHVRMRHEQCEAQSFEQHWLGGDELCGLIRLLLLKL